MVRTLRCDALRCAALTVLDDRPMTGVLLGGSVSIGNQRQKGTTVGESKDSGKDDGACTIIHSAKTAADRLLQRMQGCSKRASTQARSLLLVIVIVRGRNHRGKRRGDRPHIIRWPFWPRRVLDDPIVTTLTLPDVTGTQQPTTIRYDYYSTYCQQQQRFLFRSGD